MIKERNFSQFVDQFDLGRPEAWHDLPGLLGRMLFHFEGLDESTPPLENPVLRQFLRALHRAWPYWTVFCDLTQEDLRVMTFACLSSVRIVHIPGQHNWALFYDREELAEFLAEDFGESAEQLRWSGYSKRWICRRVAAVHEYFREPLNIWVFQPATLVHSPADGGTTKSGFLG